MFHILRLCCVRSAPSSEGSSSPSNIWCERRVCERQGIVYGSRWIAVENAPVACCHHHVACGYRRIRGPLSVVWPWRTTGLRLPEGDFRQSGAFSTLTSQPADRCVGASTVPRRKMGGTPHSDREPSVLSRTCWSLSLDLVPVLPDLRAVSRKTCPWRTVAAEKKPGRRWRLAGCPASSLA
ncbi:hypothetical protein C2845_PM07G10460 [Panicum miliaceum]|uniref:Uncharacterized protein n=1 Tax=Panicum miliaceum TaxID=4540 RepID=A0A3L6SQL1_PANMI|nr:hypothetical protein C2845_PM07G10460 [Panicum miliaceum]